MQDGGKSLELFDWGGAGLGSGWSENSSQERRSMKDAQLVTRSLGRLSHRKNKDGGSWKRGMFEKG